MKPLKKSKLSILYPVNLKSVSISSACTSWTIIVHTHCGRSRNEVHQESYLYYTLENEMLTTIMHIDLKTGLKGANKQFSIHLSVDNIRPMPVFSDCMTS